MLFDTKHACDLIHAVTGTLTIKPCLQTVLEQGGSFAGINRKVQIKPLKWSQPEEGSKEEPRVTDALLILKHGGVLTHAGRQQVRASADFAFRLWAAAAEHSWHDRQKA